MSDSLWPHELQHARPPCPSPTPGVHSDSCPSSRWCHPAISCSVVPFSSCPQSLPASESFPMSQLFAWGGQNIGVSASTSVLPMNTQDWAPLGWSRRHVNLPMITRQGQMWVATILKARVPRSDSRRIQVTLFICSGVIDSFIHSLRNCIFLFKLMAGLRLWCCVWAFSSCNGWGPLSSWLQGMDFSLWWPLLLQGTGPRCLPFRTCGS